MSYNNENYYKLREEYAEKPLRAIERADARKTELRQKVEGYAELDNILAATASRIMGAAMEGREGLDARIAKIKRETAETRDAMQILLKSAGYPADYADVHYECTACGDTGFIGTKMCACFRRALTLRGYESAGVARLIATQSFDTFSLDYYKRDPQVYTRMQHNFEAARSFAQHFSPKTSPSLLFLGGTGLGKTHLSSAIAKEVIDRGFDVLYDSAMHVFAAFENARFHGGADDTDRYLTVELLILDDLGTELGGSGAWGFPPVTTFQWEDLKEGPHTFGSIKCEVLTTPGHTPGSLSIYFPELNSIMTGDLLFYHSVGRTDFPGSSQEALRKSLHKKIFILPQETAVYPGHGPNTNVGEELANNPYLWL